jgi:hypothetical protein
MDEEILDTSMKVLAKRRMMQYPVFRYKRKPIEGRVTPQMLTDPIPTSWKKNYNRSMDRPEETY